MQNQLLSTGLHPCVQYVLAAVMLKLEKIANYVMEISSKYMARDVYCRTRTRLLEQLSSATDKAWRCSVGAHGLLRIVEHGASPLSQPIHQRGAVWRSSRKYTILSKFDEFTLFLPSKKTQISLTVPIYCELHDLLDEASERKGMFARVDEDIALAISDDMKKYEKYYTFMDESDTYYTALILDRRVKVETYCHPTATHKYYPGVQLVWRGGPSGMALAVLGPTPVPVAHCRERVP
ncbi:hypothetical protein V1520DRAFT_374075 [Lipomyces starkeyi]